MIQELKDKEKSICVIGLGYVGLPIALELAKKYKVIGFDINAKRVEQLRLNIDPNKEVGSEEFENTDITFTHHTEDLKEASFYIVAVPTPIDEHTYPNLKPLLSACETVGKVLNKGDVVVFESTVYPGCTEEDCVPILERESGLKMGIDFKVGYSPERINPGDKLHTLTKILKVVSGNDDEALEVIASLYGSVIEAGIHKASSIKVAEAAKVIENTQRDVNIALMNELSVIFNKMGINTYEVLEAAGTKWNFLNFSPGLVGGHCIGVDPYYLTFKAAEIGYHSRVILSGRGINDHMGAFVAREVIQHLIKNDISLKQCNVLVMGLTFKENVSDIRNTKVVDVINELRSFLINVDVYDPKVDEEEVAEEYNLSLVPDIDHKKYDAIVFAVPHAEFIEKQMDYYQNLLNQQGLFYDIKGAFRKLEKPFQYKTL